MKYSLPIINIVWYQNNLGSYVSLKIKFALPELAVLYNNVQSCTVLTICVPGLTGYCNCCPVAQSSSSASSGIDLNTLLILGNICFPFFLHKIYTSFQNFRFCSNTNSFAYNVSFFKYMKSSAKTVHSWFSK